MSTLTALYRYPVKSAQAETLRHSEFDGLGLTGDRRWMLIDDASGRFLTQRALPQLGRLQALLREDGGVQLSAPEQGAITVSVPGDHALLRGITLWSDTLRVPDAGDEAAAWVSRLVGKPTRLVYMPAERARTAGAAYGDPGDRVAFADGFPLLLIGSASLDDLSRRVGRSLEMLRFRPNLVIDGVPPYAEDGWKRIRIGEHEFRLLKPCSRCILTTIDPSSGQRSSDREPLATLKTYREQEGQVFFGQNLVADGAGVLEVGMPVTVLD